MHDDDSEKDQILTQTEVDISCIQERMEVIMFEYALLSQKQDALLEKVRRRKYERS